MEVEVDNITNTKKALDPHMQEFIYQFHSNGSVKRLKLPLSLPYVRDVREQALRLIKLHRMPSHLEDELHTKLRLFANEASNDFLDRQAEESLPHDSVFDKGTQLDCTIEQWAGCFAENHIQFSSPSETGTSVMNTESASDADFPEVYHKLIHSPALETLLQLEQNYAMAVASVCKGWDNARGVLRDRQESALSGAMDALGTSKSEKDINTMMRKDALDMEACEDRWLKELNQLQESQRREYRDWVTTVNLEMEASRGKETDRPTFVLRNTRPHTNIDAGLYSPTEISAPESPPLEESFTIYLGAQKKTMHNIRLLCGNPLDLCRHKRSVSGGGVIANPERLQTAMSLYSDKLSALVLMVDNRVSLLGGITEDFVSLCRHSTDFHFNGIDTQLQTIKEHGKLANQERKDNKLSMSSSSYMSESQSSHSNSLLQTSENGQTPSGSTAQFTPNSSFSVVSPNQSASFLSPDKARQSSSTPVGSLNSSDGEGKVSWTVGGSENVEGNLRSETADSVNLEAGDFYITRHSNLSQVHVVYHLVTDELAVQNVSLKARHPILQGLKSCLRTAARHDVHHITVPLLLVHNMQPEMTINWCLRRAEMVFKCVKGFMLENTAWGEGDSRTIQFLIPKEISDDLFEEFCDMLPKVFRIASTRNLTSTRARALSFK